MRIKKVPELPDQEPPDYRAETTKNSALHWLPPLVEHGRLPIPRTCVVNFDPMDMFTILDRKPVPDALPVESMIAAVREIGTPCFLRTDLSSAKHHGPGTYRIDDANRESILNATVRTFDENCAKLWDEIPLAFLFREWLDLRYHFTAFDGHRIAREWRFFVENDRVTERYFYWPWEAVKDHLDDVLESKACAAYKPLSSNLTTDERALMDQMALAAVCAIGGGDDWSVDFAQDTNQKWWLIDMALAKSSWRPKAK